MGNCAQQWQGREKLGGSDRGEKKKVVCGELRKTVAGKGKAWRERVRWKRKNVGGGMQATEAGKGKAWWERLRWEMRNVGGMVRNSHSEGRAWWERHKVEKEKCLWGTATVTGKTAQQ